MKNTAVFLPLFLLLSACVNLERLAIPKASLSDSTLKTTGTDPSPDHGPWDSFLKSYLMVDEGGLGRIAYGSVDAENHGKLKDYVETLSQFDARTLSREGQLAYWANLYNASTVSVILDHYPVSSIRKIKNGLFDLGPWNEKRLTVRGVPMSLHDIEHGVVRPLWSDHPEIHYLLNCAAVGCPSLVSFAYTENNVMQALEDNARSFINDPRGLRSENGRLTVSKIYLWYQSDFGADREALLDHLRRYANEETRKTIDNARGPLRYAYDWTLNDAP